MTDPWLAVGAIAAALTAAGAMLTPRARPRAVAMALALALAVVVVAAENWQDPRFVDLRDSGGVLLLVAAAAIAAIVGLATLFRRRPGVLPLLVVAAIPFRVPIESGGGEANLLVPLYVVIAAAVTAKLWSAIRPPRGGVPPETGSAEPGRGLPAAATRALPWVLGATVGLYALQATYSRDQGQALENLCFFYIPFAVLFVLLLRVRWNATLLAAVLAIAVSEGVVFAFVGLVEYGVRDLLWNEQVMTANEFHPYFRVNSLFWDPNILARYLAVTGAAAIAAMLWTRTPRYALASAAATLLMVAAMTLTFSQSGFLALLAAMAALAALRWHARATLALSAVIAIAAALLLLTGGEDGTSSPRTECGLNEQTGGRADLICGGLELAEDRPVAGWGSGSFSRRFERRFGRGFEDRATVSHTEPVTIAAEQGAVGLVVYVLLLGCSLAALLAGLGPLAPGLRGFAPAPGRGPPEAEPARTVVAAARAAMLAGYVAMVVHSASYAAFLTDPITWALLAIGLALARDVPRR